MYFRKGCWNVLVVDEREVLDLVDYQSFKSIVEDGQLLEKERGLGNGVCESYQTSVMILGDTRIQAPGVEGDIP